MQAERNRFGWLSWAGRSRRALVMPLVVIALVFAGATGHFGLRMLEEKGTIIALYRSGAWLAVQVQTEYLRLSDRLGRYRADPTEANRAELFQRFEIFWSRFPLLLQSEQGVGLRSLAGVVPSLRDIFADLPNLEADLIALDPARPESFASARARLESYAGPIQELSLRALHRDYFNANNQHILELQRELVFTYVVMLTAGGLLIIFLWYQNRLAGRLTAEAERARETAERAERRLHVALDSISEGFLLLDSDLRVMLVNERFYELLPQELHGFKVGDNYKSVIEASANLGFYGRDCTAAEAAERRLNQLLNPGAPIELTNPDGSQILIHEYVTADGGRVSLRADVTDLRRAEREQFELQAQFYRAQKTEALGRLAGGVAHDFNNVLMSIQGYADFLREDLPPGTAVQGYAEKILGDSKRAAALVGQLLDFGRHGGGLRRPVRLDQLAAEAVELLMSSLPKTVRIRFRNEAEGALVNADATQLSQVLMNLAVNALDAIGDKRGSIEIALGSISTDGSRAAKLLKPQEAGTEAAVAIAVEQGADGRNRLWAGLLPPGRYHQLEVIDDGSGMDLATLERIFDPFFTTKPLHEGSGLGLAAVHGIVLAHGGALSVETSPNGGTRMSVVLPALADDAADETEDEIADMPEPLDERRVLVVDDEPEVAEVVALSLRRFGGLQVETATSAHQAIERLKRGPELELVLTERNLGGANGDDLASQVHRHCPDLPVIFMVASSETVEEKGAVGAVEILRKPLEPAALRSAVERILGPCRPAKRPDLPHRVA